MDSILKLFQEFLSSLQAGQLPNLGNWNYLILAFLVAIEGPIATLLGAAAASAGLMHVKYVFLAACAGNLSADTLWYTLGYAGKFEWLLHYGRWIGLRRSHLERLQNGMHNHAPKILLLAKLTAGFVIPSLIAAGLAKVPWRKWFPFIATGEMIWTGTLVLIGYYATETIKQIEHDVRFVGLTASILFILMILWLVRRALRKREKFDENGANENEFQEG